VPRSSGHHNQEASTVEDTLVTNFFCCFNILIELHSNQGRIFESKLMHEVLKQMGVSKTKTPLHLKSNGMVERYTRTTKEHLRKVVSTHQRDWDERLPIFWLTYRASTHETTGVTPASMVLGQELCLPCDLTFRAPPDKEQSMTDYTDDLVKWLYNIHHFAHQHLKMASDQMKAHNQLANLAGLQEGDRVWLYHPTWKRGRSQKLQKC
jgi:Integrase core domain.